MSSPDIQLDFDQLLSEVIALNTDTLARIDADMQASCNTVASLTVVGWDGASKDKFLEQFSGYKSEMRAFYKKLNDFNTCLKGIHDEAEEVYEQGSMLLSAF